MPDKQAFPTKPGNRTTAIAVGLAFITGTLLAVVSCGGGDVAQQLSADKFLGGSVSGFDGPDGSDVFAQDTARDVLSGAEFDFTPDGFTLSSGPVSSDSQSGPFGLGSGRLSLSGDDASVDLAITSTDPDVQDVALVGAFSLAQAQSAIGDAGASFDVDWTLSFTGPGSTSYEISVTQTLTGFDFVPVS